MLSTPVIQLRANRYTITDVPIVTVTTSRRTKRNETGSAYQDILEFYVLFALIYILIYVCARCTREEQSPIQIAHLFTRVVTNDRNGVVVDTNTLYADPFIRCSESHAADIVTSCSLITNKYVIRFAVLYLILSGPSVIPLFISILRTQSSNYAT
jgi:hypothetical protein